jgi:hypothetical protein
MTVWIILWEHEKEAGHGIVGVYNDEQLSTKDLDLLQFYGDPSKRLKIIGFLVEGA